MVIRAILKALVLPPASNLILIVIALALYRRYTRLALITLLLSLLSLWLIATPLVAVSLVQQLERCCPPLSARALVEDGVEAIVVLGGGRYADAPEFASADVVNTATLSRLRYAVYLQSKSSLPVLVTGGKVYGHEDQGEAELMADTLSTYFGIEATWVENKSRTTRENAFFSSQLLQKNDITRIAVVTQAWHMRRAVREFQRQGMTVIPAPVDFVSGPAAPAFVIQLMPDARALHLSRIALKEWLGYWFYTLEHVWR